MGISAKEQKKSVSDAAEKGSKEEKCQ